ncbi:MAG: substrate-binding domain-containing protein [Xanthobacteraceae bacterium]
MRLKTWPRTASSLSIRPRQPKTGVSLADLPSSNRLKVDVAAVGTGEALALGRRGFADAVFVHDRPAEDQFVADGYGVDRRDVMYDDFVVVGPSNDPAHIRGCFAVPVDQCSLAGRLSSAPKPRGRPEGNDLLRANQPLRWVDIAQAEKMCDGRKPFWVFDQKQSNDHSQSEE